MLTDIMMSLIVLSLIYFIYARKCQVKMKTDAVINVDHTRVISAHTQTVSIY